MRLLLSWVAFLSTNFAIRCIEASICWRDWMVANLLINTFSYFYSFSTKSNWFAFRSIRLLNSSCMSICWSKRRSLKPLSWSEICYWKVFKALYTSLRSVLLLIVFSTLFISCWWFSSYRVLISVESVFITCRL